jgi:hypothetical protein
LWSDDTFVDFEQGIHKAIKQIRTALGDSAEEPTYVETVSRRGYRVLTDVGFEGLEDALREQERCPYPGLSEFTSKDAKFFFGREEEVEATWRKLETKRLLALIGPAGAGKSSLLQAGLLPARPQGWGALICRLRENPFASIARALRAELALEGDSSRVLDSDDAISHLKVWRQSHPEVVLCIDAFEELFTLNDESTQTEFAKFLKIVSEELTVHVMLAMRDDFLILCHDYSELDEIFHDITPLKSPRGTALRRALVEPARLCGYRFEDEALVADILTEVTNERASLALLGFAAASLWAKRDRQRSLLTREAYLEIGGVGGALAQHAEAVLTTMGSDCEPFVREILRNLTTAKGTRVSQHRGELLSVFEDENAAETVLQKLTDARLVTSFNASDSGAENSGHKVEITHETLLSAWPRLVRWQAQDAGEAVLRDQLRQSSRAWQDRGCPEDLLWTGASFQDLSLWRAGYRGGLTVTEQAFAEASTSLAGRRRGKRRLALASVVAAAVAVTAAGIWARYQAVSGASAALTQQTLESASGYAALIAAVVDRNLSAVQREVERASSDPHMRQWILRAQSGDALAPRALQTLTDSLYETYRERHLHNWVVADANAVVLARTPFDDRVVGSRYAYREWFSGVEDVRPEEAPSLAKPRTAAGVTLAYESTAAGNPLLVSVASPVWSEDRSEIVGVLAGTVHLATFNEWLVEAEGEESETGCPDRFGVLVNRGQLVRHPCLADHAVKLPVSRESYFDKPEVSRLVSSDKNQIDSFLDPMREGRPHFAATARFRENRDWIAIVEHDRVVSMSPVTNLVGAFSALGWLAAGFGIAVVAGLWVLLFHLTRE